MVLDDGLIIGTDTNNGIAQFRADLDARREIGTAVLNALGSGGQTAAISYLQGLATTPAQGGLMAASRQSSPELAYAASISVFRTRLARPLLGLAQHDPVAVEKMARKFATQEVPTLHR